MASHTPAALRAARLSAGSARYRPADQRGVRSRQEAAAIHGGSPATERVHVLTSAQIGELETFHEDSIGGGALAFDFPDPFDSTVTLSVAFVDPPSWSNVGGDLYSVRLNLEVLP